MACVYREYGCKIKNGTGAMTTAKYEDFIGLWCENCLLVWGEWTFGGGVYWVVFSCSHAQP